MRTLSKLAKFFIICAAVFFVGLVCAIAGAAGGGVGGIDKLAEKHDWIQGSPGEKCVTCRTVREFHSIEATGDGDLWIVGKDFYKNDRWLADHDLQEQIGQDLIGPGSVCVIRGENVEQPEITVKNGVLTINAGQHDFSGISFDASGASWPKVIVCVPDGVLQSLTVSGQSGDISCLGCAWDSAKIQMNSGDVDMEGVKSGGLVIDLDSGDAEIQGKFMAETQIQTTSGDVEIDTVLPKTEYALELRAEAGDITLKERGKEDREYDDVPAAVTESGGPHRIAVMTSAGDQEVSFQAD